VSVVRLLKHRDVRATTDRSPNANASVIDHLDAHRSRRKQAADERAPPITPRFDWLVDVAVAQLRASTNPHV
jgi:hypothetical protein